MSLLRVDTAENDLIHTDGRAMVHRPDLEHRRRLPRTRQRGRQPARHRAARPDQLLVDVADGDPGRRARSASRATSHDDLSLYSLYSVGHGGRRGRDADRLPRDEALDDHRASRTTTTASRSPPRTSRDAMPTSLASMPSVSSRSSRSTREDDILERARTPTVAARRRGRGLRRTHAGQGRRVRGQPATSTRALQQVCRDHGVLIVCDEIFTGFYRTGPCFRHPTLGIEPDIVLVGKAIANGFPACGRRARPSGCRTTRRTSG